MKNISILFLLFFSLSTSARAYNGSDLLNYCSAYEGTSEIERADDGVCVGYIYGVTSGLYLSQSLNKDNYFCLPESAQPVQITLVVLKYLKETPETLHYDGSALVLNALIKAFPCSE